MYSLSVLVTKPDGTDAWEPLVDGTVEPDSTMQVVLVGQQGTQMEATAYRGETALLTMTSGQWAAIALQPGLNRLGFFVRGMRGSELEAIDFVSVTVIGPGSTASPSEEPLTPEPADEPTDEPVPTPEPEPAFDCNTTPPPGGIKLMEWQLKCGDGVISTAPP